MLDATATPHETREGLLATLLAGEAFWPSEPRTIQETGLPQPFVEALICKSLLADGTNSGHGLADILCLPFGIVEGLLGRLRSRQWIIHVGSSMFNDYRYSLTDEGRRHAIAYQQACSYIGPVPVPLMDYVIAVEAQAISAEAIRREDLEDAFHDISIPPQIFDQIGPAVNSAAGMFLYGAPGNGKSTLARRITSCFGQEVWIPHAILEGNDLLRVFDPAYHHEVRLRDGGLSQTSGYDKRWRRIRRPTVIVGGELTMDSLDVRHDPRTNISEAPLQLKSNCGCLLIDDFGRQRVSPAELLNRWIVPLESRFDFLTFSSGKKIQVPFEQLIIFSTNLDPNDLVDEAFLRRIPYKIEISDPVEEEFHQLFRLAAESAGCEYVDSAVEHLLERWYRPFGRQLRRCHARDILQQIRNLCSYEGRQAELRPEYLDRVAASCFTQVLRADPNEARPMRAATGAGSSA